MKHIVWLFIILLAGCNVASPTLPNGGSGGHSIISYLQKQQSGLVFSEGFENDNFISADGWTTVQGVPTNTSLQSKQGIKSFLCNGTASSLSIISKTLTQSQNVQVYGIWFYDDGTTTAGTGPYIKCKTNLGNWYQMGIRNSVSTTKISANGAGQYGQDQFTASTTPRQTGQWNNYLMILVGGVMLLAENGTAVISLSDASTYISSIYVNSGTTSDTLGTFGYFDSLTCTQNPGNQSSLPVILNFSGTRRIALYDQNFTYLSATTATSTYNIGTLINTAVLYPYQVHIQISSSSNTNQVEYTSQLLNLYGGDIYQYQTIDFGRKVTTYDPFVKELQSVNISTAGVRETNNYGLKGDLTFSANKLEGYQWRQSVENFFLNSVQGNPFGLMVDNVTDNCFAPLGTSSAANASSLVLGQNLGSPDKTSLFSSKSTSTSQYVVVQNASNTNKQILQVTGITTSSLSFDQTLNFATNPGDYVYSLLYYPFLEVNGNSPTGFKVTDPSIPRYNWTQSCSEYDNG